MAKLSPPFHSPTYRKAFNHGLDTALVIVRAQKEQPGPDLRTIWNIICHPVLAIEGAVKAQQARIENVVQSKRQPD